MTADYETWLPAATKDLVPEAAEQARARFERRPFDSLPPPEVVNRDLCREFLTDFDVNRLRASYGLHDPIRDALSGRTLGALLSLQYLFALIIPFGIILLILLALQRLAEFPWTALTVVAFAITVPVVGIGSTIWSIRQTVKRYCVMTLYERVAYSMRWEVVSFIVWTTYAALYIGYKPIYSDIGEFLMVNGFAVALPLTSLYAYLARQTLLRKLRNTGPVAALAEIERPAPVPA